MLYNDAVFPGVISDGGISYSHALEAESLALMRVCIQGVLLLTPDFAGLRGSPGLVGR